MRRVSRIAWFHGAALAVTTLLMSLLATRYLPTGYEGEWTWQRLGADTELQAGDLILAASGIVIYAFMAALIWRRLSRIESVGRWTEIASLGLLIPMALGVQIAIFWGAPAGYGLTKWATLGMPGASGYFEVAQRDMGDPAAFLRDYPQWIRGQDSLHVGTHPPGLFVVSRWIQELVEAQPALARSIDALLPNELRRGIMTILGARAPEQRAMLAIGGVATMFACVLTTLPLYGLVRGSGGSARMAWASAVLWPLIPAALLFQPAADTAFPLLSTAALAMTARGRVLEAALAGLILGVGMLFTLAFLAVGLVVALLILFPVRWSDASWQRQAAKRLLATGMGFLVVAFLWWGWTGGNPFVTWWWNQANHARFYVEYPRSYQAWVLINPVELIIAVGVPVAFWAVVGTGSRIPGAQAAWPSLFVLVLLTLTGRSLSEVARLWLPFYPPLLALAAMGMERMGGRSLSLAALVLMLAGEVLALQAMLQVVYPA